MRLSVVVAIYNEGKYLDECIKSIINQTKRDIEVVLVDDGSTDASGSICDGWGKKDERIRVIHKEHEGTLLARVEGIKSCTCDYITFVDADDFVDKNSFALSDKYMNDNIDVICFGINRYYNSTYILQKNREYETGVYKKEEIDNKIIPTMIWDANKCRPGLDPSLCTKVIKKQLFEIITEKFGAFNLDIGDDMALAYPCILNADSLAMSESVYYNHRQRSKDDIAPYFNNSDYFDKLYYLYSTLRSFFCDEKQVVSQIEQVYASLVVERNIAVRLGRNYFRYLFPFNKVKSNSIVVLYGAGNVGREYHEQLKKLAYCKNLTWVDRSWEKYSELNVQNPEIINYEKVDYVVIAVLTETVQKSIVEYLINKGLPQNKIVLAER